MQLWLLFVWQCGGALWLPEPLGLYWLFCHPLLWFSPLCSLALGWVRFWPAVSAARVGFVVSPPSDVSVCPSPALAGQVWSQSFGPSCCSCGLSSRGVSAAAFCPLGLLSHPLLLLFLAWISSFGVCSGLGWKAAVLSWFLPSFGGGGSPSLVLVVFAWRFQLFCCPSSLSFLELFAGVLSSRFQCLLIAWGG